MSNEPLRLAVIISSVREGRMGPQVSEWFATQARERSDYTVDVIDLADHELPAAIQYEPSAQAAEALATISPRLEAADAFVVVVPEYNHSYPASLKHLIDWHFTPWRAKPVGFVSYGGMAGGLRAVEHLRSVFAEMHAVTVRDGISFHTVWEQFGEDGALKDTEGPGTAAKVLLDQLGWWGTVLREGRAKTPYEA